MARHLKRSDVPPLCFTLSEFATAHRLGLSKYYELREQGLGPLEIRLGGKILITQEAAQKWRAERDAEAAAAAADERAP